MSDPPSCTSSFCAPSGDAVRLAVVAAAANELTTSKRYIWCYIYNEFGLHPLNIVWGLEWSEVWFVSGEQGFAESGNHMAYEQSQERMHFARRPRAFPAMSEPQIRGALCVCLGTGVLPVRPG